MEGGNIPCEHFQIHLHIHLENNFILYENFIGASDEIYFRMEQNIFCRRSKKYTYKYNTNKTYFRSSEIACSWIEILQEN